MTDLTEPEWATNEQRIKQAERILEMSREAYHLAVEVNRRFKMHSTYVLAAGAMAFSLFGANIESFGRGVGFLLGAALVCFGFNGYLAMLIWLPRKSSYPNTDYTTAWKSRIRTTPETSLANEINNWNSCARKERKETDKISQLFKWMLISSIAPIVLTAVAFMISKAMGTD